MPLPKYSPKQTVMVAFTEYVIFDVRYTRSGPEYLCGPTEPYVVGWRYDHGQHERTPLLSYGHPHWVPEYLVHPLEGTHVNHNNL